MISEVRFTPMKLEKARRERDIFRLQDTIFSPRQAPSRVTGDGEALPARDVRSPWGSSVLLARLAPSTAPRDQHRG